MTNDQLSYILRNVDCSKGRSVRIVDNLEAILLERHKTVTSNSGCRYVEYYDYLIILKGEVKAGIIQKCQFEDIHIYVYPRYRNQGIVSKLTGNGFLKELWSDINSVTCANRSEYEKIKYLVENAGFWLRN